MEGKQKRNYNLKPTLFSAKKPQKGVTQMYHTGISGFTQFILRGTRRGYILSVPIGTVDKIHQRISQIR